jgi:hypothetical protein
MAFFLGSKYVGKRIRDEPIPHRFKIQKNIRQYNGVDRPLTWLQDYCNAVQFAGGSLNVVVCYLPLMLSGTARQWINDLAENSIQTWFDMQIAVTENFEGTYKRPHNIGDLQRCQRADDETSQTFLPQFPCQAMLHLQSAKNARTRWYHHRLWQLQEGKGV